MALPWDTQYEQEKSNLAKRQALSNQGTAFEGKQLEQQYGYTDTSNPFNLAAMMQKAYQQNQAGTTNRLASRGQLYSGSLQRASTENKFQFSRQKDEAKRAYDRAKFDIGQRKQGAQLDYDEGLTSASSQRLDRATSRGPEDDGGDDGGDQRISRGRKAYLRGLRRRTNKSSRQRYRKKYRR